MEAQTLNQKPTPLLASAVKGVPIFGHTFAALSNVLELAMSAQKAFPRMCLANLGFKRTWLVFHPDLVAQILVKNANHFDKETAITTSIRSVLGRGLLSSEGDQWRSDRRMLQPLFSPQHMREKLPDLERIAADEVAKLASLSGQSIDLVSTLMRIALRLMSEIVLGEDLSFLSQQVDREFMRLTEIVYSRAMTGNWPLGIPLPSHFELKKIRRHYDSIIGEIIERRRTAATSSNDKNLLNLLFAARDVESGATLSSVEIKDQVMTFFLAGHETTAHALLWSMYELSRHPLNGASVRAFVNETMRLHPPAWSMMRHCIHDTEVDGHLVKKNDLVVVFQYATHRHPDFWPDPERFDPLRFEGEAAQASRHKFAYFPFGAGPRNCIGQHLAQASVEIFLTAFVRSLRIKSIIPSKIDAHAKTTLGLKGPIRATLEPIA
jgi:cytochrome P450